MKEISFTIIGNSEETNGNPIGYKRLLKNKIRDADYRYINWCEHVRKAYYDAYPSMAVFDISFKSNRDTRSTPKPFQLKFKKAYLHTMMYFSDNKHADPDNVQKGIADALFENDKKVAGTYDFEMSKEKEGRVLVKIIFEE